MLKRLRHAMRVRLIRVVEEVMQRHEAVLRCEVEAGLRREADRVIQEIRGVELAPAATCSPRPNDELSQPARGSPTRQCRLH